jgi:hypothetical protein
MQSNEEEGFTCEPKTELVELNYIPMFSHLKYIPNTYQNPLALPTPYLRLPASFINQKLNKRLA